MKNQIYRGSSVQFTLLLLLMASVSVKCRQWQSIVDHDIVFKSNIDSSRYELKIESDPFFYPGDKSPTDIPTEAPKADAIKVWTTVGPTAPPSMVPIDGTSIEPTDFTIEQNDGCRNGLKHYEVHMMDTWGDGWDQTVITITGISDQNTSVVDLPTDSITTTHTNTQGDMIVSISKTIEFDSTSSSIDNPNPGNEIDPLGQIFQGSLQQGYHDFANVCLLPNRCYQFIATGGEFSEEVSWELRPGNNDPESPSVLLEPILTGSAPTACTFSLPDENGEHLCPNTCSDEILANSMTSSPEIIENLQPNEDEMAAEPLSEAVGGTQTAPMTGTLNSLLSRTAGTGNSAATAWNKFKLVDTDENTSN